MKLLPPLRKIILGFYLWGILFHAIPQTRELVLQSTPFLLIPLNALLYIYFYRKSSSSAVQLWLACVAFATFTIEVIGVQTGMVFGTYAYSSILGPAILGTPLLIGILWTNIITGISGLVDRFHYHILLKSLNVSLVTVLFDVLLEPVAIKLGYWNWAGGQIPVKNYIAWAIISFVSSYTFFRLKKDVKVPEEYTYFITGNVLFLLSMLLI